MMEHFNNLGHGRAACAGREGYFFYFFSFLSTFPSLLPLNGEMARHDLNIVDLPLKL